MSCIIMYTIDKTMPSFASAIGAPFIGLEAGLEEEELLNMELGVSADGTLTDTQRKYKEKVREKLIQRGEEIKKEEKELKERLARNIMLGQKAYEYGEYAQAVKFLEQGVKEAGAESMIGGEGQLWLALAYQVSYPSAHVPTSCASSGRVLGFQYPLNDHMLFGR